MHFGRPTLVPPPAVLAAAHASIDRGPHGYVALPELRKRTARRYRETHGLKVAPKRILLTTGASTGLVATFTTLFAPGERVGLARPGYPAYRNALPALDPVLLAKVPDPLHGLVLASPANPTGAQRSHSQLAALAHACRERGTQLISDEIHHGITYGEPDAIELQSAVASYAHNRERVLAELPQMDLQGSAPPDGAFDLHVDVGHLTQDSRAF